MRIGLGKAEITPPVGSRMCGFGFRDHGSEGVHDDLEVRVFWIEDEGRAACIVTADVLGFDDAITARFRGAISERFGIKPEAIFLSASHTHSGPPTCASNFRVGGPPVESYIQMFQQITLDAVVRARSGLRPVALSVGRSSLTGFAINRRVTKNGKTEMGPNPDGIRDDEVTALVFRDTEARIPLAVLFHYTCHPTVMADYRFTGDYPGAARRFVDAALPGVQAGFLAGCPGEIRPNCAVMGGGSFRRGGTDDVAAYGKALGEQVLKAVESAAPSGKTKLASNAITVPLKLADGHRTVPLTLSRIDLAEDVALVGIGGDTCVDYGLFVKTLRPGKTTVPVGYTNGVIAYLCPERYFAEGGYEPNDSWLYFGLPGPLSPKNEEVIRRALKEL